MTGHKLHVLHVVDRTTGGVPLAVAAYIRATPEVKHTVLAPFSNGLPDALWSQTTATTADLGDRHLARIFNVRHIVGAQRFDAVHAHSSFAGLYTRLALSHRSLHVVYSPHCFKFDDPECPSWLRTSSKLVEKTLARRTSTFAVLSTHEAQLAKRLTAHTSAKTVLIPNTPAVPLRDSPRSPETGAVRVVTVGRIAPQKSPKFFLEVQRLLRDAKHPIEFRWIGGGEASMREELVSAGVHVTGWVTVPEVCAELDSAEIYLHTAAYEGFPLSVLDAAARGLPILARDIPALSDANLMTFNTAEEAASLITNLAQDVSLRDELTRRSEQLLAAMNVTTQRGALLASWTPVRPGP